MLVCASCLTANSLAWAVPTFGVTAEGTCPSQEELTQAVVAKGWSHVPRLTNSIDRRDYDRDYDIVSRTDSTGATLELQRPGRATLVARRFASHDCRALADAMLVVVEAYFVDMGEPVLAPESTRADLEHPTARTAIDASNAEPSWLAIGKAAPRNAPAATAAREATPNHPNATSAVTDVTSQPPATVAPRSTDARTMLATPTRPNRVPSIAGTVSQPRGTVTTRSTYARTTPSAPIPTQLEEPSKVIARLRGFAGLGAALAMPQNDAVRLVSPVLQLGAGVVFAALPLSTEVVIGSGQRSTSGEIPNRVERWASHALVRAGWLFPPMQPELRPWFGAGVQWATLRAVDLRDAQTRSSISSLAGLGLEAAMPISNGWSTRAELSCLFCGTREHYQVSAGESLGYGPRVVCLATLGVSLEKQP